MCITMPIFVSICLTIAEIWPIFDFQDGAIRHLGQLLMLADAKRPSVTAAAAI